MSTQQLSWGHLSTSGISQLLLTKSWHNFKCRVLWPSLRKANCHNDIFPTYVLAIFVHIRKISAVIDTILTKLFDPIFWGPWFLSKICFCPNIFWTKFVLWPTFFRAMGALIFRQQFFVFYETSSDPNICWANFFYLNFLEPDFC